MRTKRSTSWRLDIRIVFTDIDMPWGMDGMRLAACIRERWPPIEIILTSGHHAIENVVLPARGVFFAKPYRPGDIVAALHRMARGAECESLRHEMRDRHCDAHREPLRLPLVADLTA